VLRQCQFVIYQQVAVRRYKLIIYVIAEILFAEMCEHKELPEMLNCEAVGLPSWGIWIELRVFNRLKTTSNQFYLKTQFEPRSKHLSRL
jgi:hypothetical protein